MSSKPWRCSSAPMRKRERTAGSKGAAPRRGRQGFTLVELLSTLAIAALLLTALAGVVHTALSAYEDGDARNALARDADFALERMVRAVGRSPRLLIPLVDKDWSTGVDESLRDPGVLAVSLDPTLDRDLDGVADADNDGDGRVDEDFSEDWTNDGKPGIAGIDDDGDGSVDEGNNEDDDESGDNDEDPIDGLDDDDDQNVDEDPPEDANNDAAPGIALVDDDGDGSIDEGNDDDDDEDGAGDEDWIDPVVFFLSGGSLIERFPDPGATDGNDYTERAIAEDVTAFVVQRLPRTDERADLVELTLSFARGDASLTLSTRVRVGGSL